MNVESKLPPPPVQISTLNLINTNSSEQLVKSNYVALMEELGKKFFAITKINSRYKDIMSGIRNYIDKNIPVANDEEKEKLSYRCFYDRLVYGNTMLERQIFDFENKTHEEKNSYVTYWKLVSYYEFLNKRADIDVFINKHKQYKLLKKYFKRDLIPIADETDYEDFCSFIGKHVNFLVKISSGSLGEGIYKDSIKNYKTSRELFTKLLSNKKVVVLEELIEQSSEMAELHPQSVNTIRITTVRVRGETNIFYPFLKAGTGNSVVDNGGSGGYLAGINVESGIVDTDFFDEFTHYLEPVEYHPNSKIKICGFQIPHWQEAVSLAKEVANQLAKRMNLNYIGWDLAFTPDGWIVVEGNAGAFLVAPQMVYKKPLREEFENLIGWETRR